MNQRVDNIQANLQTLFQGGEQVSEKNGTFMGEAVKTLQNADALIADAAEELTFSAGEEVERKLSERKDSKDKSLHQILFYVSQAGDINQNDLEQLMKALVAMKGAKSAQMLDMVKQMFSDPTNRHAALSYAGAKFEEMDLPEEEKKQLLAAVRESIKQLEAEDGRAINAGYNIAGVKAQGLDIPGPSLRVLYRDTVIDFEDYKKTFSSMLQKFGPEEFPKAVEFLIKALGSDMNAITPSSPKAALKEVADGLYMVESLGTIYKDSSKLLDGAKDKHGPHSIAPKDVIEPLLRYKDQPMVSGLEVRQDMPFLETSNAVRDAELTQGVRELARKVPHKLYASPEVRQNVLNALQEVLDLAVDREEMEAEQ